MQMLFWVAVWFEVLVMLRAIAGAFLARWTAVCSGGAVCCALRGGIRGAGVQSFAYVSLFGAYAAETILE